MKKKNKSKSKAKGYLLVFFLSITLSFLLTTGQANAWYGTYSHYKEITLSNTTSDSMAYPVIRMFESRYGSSSWYDGVNITGLSFTGTNATLEIAVTDSGDNPIQFQVLDYDSTWAIILPMIASRTGNNDIVFRVYYELASPSIDANYRTIRYFADEFNGTTLDTQWQVRQGSAQTTVSNGILNVTGTSANSVMTLMGKYTYPIANWRLAQTVSSKTDGQGLNNQTSLTGSRHIGFYQYNTGTIYCTVGNGYDDSCGTTDTNYHTWRVKYNSTHADHWIDNILKDEKATVIIHPVQNFSFLAIDNGGVDFVDYVRLYNSTIGINFYNSTFSVSIGGEQSLTTTTTSTTTTTTTTPTPTTTTTAIPTTTTPIPTTTTVISNGTNVNVVINKGDFDRGYCVDAYTLAKNSTDLVYLNGSVSNAFTLQTKPCEYGCDAKNGVCNPSDLQQILIILGVALGVLGFVALLNWLIKRLGI